MSLQEKLWDENPLKQLAEKSIHAPGMYLIALREHLNRGRNMIGEMVDLVSESVPQPARSRISDE